MTWILQEEVRGWIKEECTSNALEATEDEGYESRVPGPLKVEVPMFFVLTTTTLPGPLAAARGEVRGT